VPVLKTVSHLPVIVDPSHAAGVRCLVPVLSRAAAVVGADGLLVEVHPSPDQALSDGAQSLTFRRFPRHDGRSATLSGDSRCRQTAAWSATGRRRGSRLVRARPITVGAALFRIITIVGFAPTRSVFSSGADSPALPFHGREAVRAAGMDSRRRSIQLRRNHIYSRRERSTSAGPRFCGFGRSRRFVRRQESAVRRQAKDSGSLANLGTYLGRRGTTARYFVPEDCVRPFYLPDDRVRLREEERAAVL
jgi:hypothetical protein